MVMTSGGVRELLHEEMAGRSRLGEQPSKAALETLSMIARPDLLVGLLSSLRTDGSAAACAAGSYEHPLGFSKIVLVDAEPAFKLRMHVWWPTSKRSAAHVHNHRFAFASAVVRGEYDMQIFQQDQAGRPMSEYTEQPAGGTGGWRLDARGTANLRRMTSLSLKEGSCYSLPITTLHQVVVRPGALCATLVLQAAVVGSATQVFAEVGSEVRSTTEMHAFTDDSYRRRLDELLFALTR